MRASQRISTAERQPVGGDHGRSIFPTFDVRVPLPADTSAPESEAPAQPASPTPATPDSEG